MILGLQDVQLLTDILAGIFSVFEPYSSAHWAIFIFDRSESYRNYAIIAIRSDNLIILLIVLYFYGPVGISPDCLTLQFVILDPSF